jgi:Spy/CpxP family protein refolding chaperone
MSPSGAQRAAERATKGLNIMHLRHTVTWLGLPVLMLAAGCSGAPTGEGTGQTSAATQTTNVAAPAANRFRARMAGGPAVFLLTKAVSKLDLDSATQAKVQGLIAQLKQKPQHPAIALRADMASAMSSGNVDSAALDKDLTTIETNVRARINTTDDVLNELHATLSAPQRALLVQQIKTELAGMKQRHAAWHERGHARQRGGWFAKKLGLSAEQIATLKAKAPAKPEGNRHERRAMMRKLLAAFVQDQFDAHQVLDANAIATHARARVEYRLQRMSALSSVLTSTQRTQLTTMMQAHRMHPLQMRAPLANPSVAK